MDDVLCSYCNTQMKGRLIGSTWYGRGSQSMRCTIEMYDCPCCGQKAERVGTHIDDTHTYKTKVVEIGKPYFVR